MGFCGDEKKRNTCMLTAVKCALLNLCSYFGMFRLTEQLSEVYREGPLKPSETVSTGRLATWYCTIYIL